MKISVIVPIFNNAPFLRESIDSILSSEGVEIELILVDDGSTDGSSAICDEYEAKVLHNENHGVAYSRNAGLAGASGEYTAFVDSDDIVDSDYFAEMLDFAVKNDCDITFSGLRYFSESKEKADKYESINVEQGVYSKDKITNCIINPMISGGMKNPLKQPITGSACICLFKTGLIKDIKFPQTKISEDLIFQLNALSKAERVGKIDGYKYAYRVIKGRESRSGKYAPNLWEQQTELISYMDGFDSDTVYGRWIYQALRCCGNECVAANTGSIFEKIKRIKKILSHKSVINALEKAKNYDYPLKTRFTLSLMRMKAATVIFIYLSIKKRKGG